MTRELVKIEPLSFTTQKGRKFELQNKKHKPIKDATFIGSMVSITSFLYFLMLSQSFIIATLSTVGFGMLLSIPIFLLQRKRQRQVLNDNSARFHCLLNNSVLWFNDRARKHNQALLEAGMDDSQDMDALAEQNKELLVARKELKAKIEVVAPSQLTSPPCLIPMLNSLQQLQNYERALPPGERFKLLPAKQSAEITAEIDKELAES